MLFAYQHQPFAYFQRFDPATARGLAERRLRDAKELEIDIKSGQLPPVSFYKPTDINSEHPGYGSVAAGNAVLGRLRAMLNSSPTQRVSCTLCQTARRFSGAQHFHCQPGGHDLSDGGRHEGLVSVLNHQLVALLVHHEHQPRRSERRELLLGTGQGVVGVSSAHMRGLGLARAPLVLSGRMLRERSAKESGRLRMKLTFVSSTGKSSETRTWLRLASSI